MLSQQTAYTGRRVVAPPAQLPTPVTRIVEKKPTNLKELLVLSPNNMISPSQADFLSNLKYNDQQPVIQFNDKGFIIEIIGLISKLGFENTQKYLLDQISKNSSKM